MSCCASSCSSRTTNGGLKNQELSFHTFPKCPDIRQEWIKAVGRDNWEPTKYSRLCSKHFEKTCFLTGLSIKKLKSDAVPTIFETFQIMSSNYHVSNYQFLPNDMENYIQYTVMGSVPKIRMKPDCVPTKFECQPDRVKRTASTPKPRSAVTKRQRLELMQEIFCKDTDITAPSGVLNDSVKTEESATVGDDTVNSITTPELKECKKEQLSDEETPQTSKDVQMEMHSSSTESAESDTEDTSTLTTHEDTKWNAIDKTETTIWPIVVTSTTESSNLNKTEDLQIPSTAKISAIKRREKMLEERKKQMSDALRKRQEAITQFQNKKLSKTLKDREDNIERFKGYTIIANVYDYLKREYEYIKSLLCEECDVSSLSDVLTRTAAATGTSRSDVTAALKARKLKSNVQEEHCYQKNVSKTTANKNVKARSRIKKRMKKRPNVKQTTKEQTQQNVQEVQKEPQRPLKSKVMQRKISENAMKVRNVHEVQKEPQRPLKRKAVKRKISDKAETVRQENTEGLRRSKRRLNKSSDATNIEEEVPFPTPIQLESTSVSQIKNEPGDNLLRVKIEPLDTGWLDGCASTHADVKLEPDDVEDDLQQVKCDAIDIHETPLYPDCEEPQLDIKPEPPQ